MEFAQVNQLVGLSWIQAHWPLFFFLVHFPPWLLSRHVALPWAGSVEVWDIQPWDLKPAPSVQVASMRTPPLSLMSCVTLASLFTVSASDFSPVK